MATYSAKGVSAVYITGESHGEMRKGVEKGYSQLVYITPELLLCNSRWRKMITKDTFVNRLEAFIVNEARTVKKGEFKEYIIL